MCARVGDACGRKTIEYTLLETVRATFRAVKHNAGVLLELPSDFQNSGVSVLYSQSE